MMRSNEPRDEPWALRLLAVALIVFGLTGCLPSHQGDEPERSRPPVSSPAGGGEFPSTVEGDQSILVNRYTNRLAIYDLRRHEVVGEDNREQTFVYVMPDRSSNLVTIGSSATGNFQIARLTSNRIEMVLSSESEGVFPLASGAGHAYFIVADFDADGRIAATSIATLRDSTLVKLLAPADPVVGGAVLGTRLWFTTYSQEADRYTLHSTPLDGSGTPRTERGGLRDGRLYSYENRLVTDGVFTAGVKRMSCQLYCVVDEPSQLLLNLGTSDEGALELKAFDLTSGNQAVVAQGDIVDFTPTPEGLTVYYRSAVKQIAKVDLP